VYKKDLLEKKEGIVFKQRELNLLHGIGQDSHQVSHPVRQFCMQQHQLHPKIVLKIFIYIM